MKWSKKKLKLQESSTEKLQKEENIARVGWKIKQEKKEIKNLEEGKSIWK